MTSDTPVHELFTESMTLLASGVAVIPARRQDGAPLRARGHLGRLLQRSPAVADVLDLARSRCHDALAASDHFGVHLLRSDELELAHRFADRELPDKFDGLTWSWDGDVPELEGTLAYLRCRRADNFVRYDHTILIGDLDGGASRKATRWSTRGGAWTGSCGRCSSQPHPDHLEPAGQGAVGELGLLRARVPEELVVVAQRVFHEHARGQRKQLVEGGLNALAQLRVGALLLQEPGAVGHVTVLVAGDVREALLVGEIALRTSPA